MPSAALIDVLGGQRQTCRIHFRSGWEWREAALELDGLQALTTPGQDLVRISLVADVPDQAVMGRIENVMQRDGQLDRAKSRGEVAAHLADRLHQEFAHLGRERRQLCGRELAQISGGIDPGKQRVFLGGGHSIHFTPSAQRPVWLPAAREEPVGQRCQGAGCPVMCLQ
jgi:hypothetical protein